MRLDPPPSISLDRRHIDQYEQFFVARVSSRTITPSAPDPDVIGHRWWTLDEIITSSELSLTQARHAIGFRFCAVNIQRSHSIVESKRLETHVGRAAEASPCYSITSPCDCIGNASNQRTCDQELTCASKVSTEPDTDKYPHEVIQSQCEKVEECPTREPDCRWYPDPGCCRWIESPCREPTCDARGDDDRSEQR